jgi:1,2-diacylglycerol 3-beta-glucosyltransferase
MILVLSGSLTAVLISYTFFMVAASRRAQLLPVRGERDGRLIVFVVPCLNEELVIGRTLERLLSIEDENFAILVVDDASDDRTVEVVRPYLSDRTWLLERRLPLARLGKGRALNAGYRHLLGMGAINSRSSDDVIVAVVDADGRLEPDACTKVRPYFDNPAVGAVQVGVRMYNADQNLLTRLQDFEFVTYAEVFQRSRSRVGTSGLGGNGQFNRLSALIDLGLDPWSDCLTEDLDLGLKLVVKGWSMAFCSDTSVSQQAIPSLPSLIRQRSRWFQGHLQCWRNVRPLLHSRRPMKSTSGLLHHLISPILIGFLTIPVLLFVGSLVTLAAISPGLLEHTLTAHYGLLPAMWYILSFGLAIPYSLLYARHGRTVSWPKALVHAHLYSLYSLLWFPACWIALSRVARGHRDWTKTARAPDLTSLALPVTAGERSII